MCSENSSSICGTVRITKLHKHCFNVKRHYLSPRSPPSCFEPYHWLPKLKPRTNRRSLAQTFCNTQPFQKHSQIFSCYQFFVILQRRYSVVWDSKLSLPTRCPKYTMNDRPHSLLLLFTVRPASLRVWSTSLMWVRCSVHEEEYMSTSSM